MGTTVSIGYLRDVVTPIDFLLFFSDNILTFTLECIHWFLSPRCGLTGSRHLKKCCGFYFIFQNNYLILALLVCFVCKYFSFSNSFSLYK